MYKQENINQHVSMRGKVVDMNKLINDNENTIAVGNMKVNARGDELGPGGKIIRKKEQVIQTANRNIPIQNSNSIKNPIEKKTEEVLSENNTIKKNKKSV